MSDELLKRQLAEAMRANADLKHRLQAARIEISELRALLKLMRSASWFTENREREVL